MSLLRAKCPSCKTLTAVAIGPEYECHSCGRTFAAGLVRVPRAWGDAASAMIESAALPLDYRRRPLSRRVAARAEPRDRGRPAGAAADPRRVLLLARRRGRRACGAA